MKLLPQNEAVLPGVLGETQKTQEVKFTRLRELLIIIGFTRYLPKVI